MHTQLVHCLPLDATTDIQNCSEIRGKAVIVQRGESTFREKVDKCINKAGANVVIIFNNDPTTKNLLPFIGDEKQDEINSMSPLKYYYKDIPVLFVSFDDGKKLLDLDYDTIIEIKQLYRIDKLEYKIDPYGNKVSQFKPITKKVDFKKYS